MKLKATLFLGIAVVALTLASCKSGKTSCDAYGKTTTEQPSDLASTK
jgi:hypothetical protein